MPRCPRPGSAVNGPGTTLRRSPRPGGALLLEQRLVASLPVGTGPLCWADLGAARLPLALTTVASLHKSLCDRKLYVLFFYQYF